MFSRCQKKSTIIFMVNIPVPIDFTMEIWDPRTRWWAPTNLRRRGRGDEVIRGKRNLKRRANSPPCMVGRWLVGGFNPSEEYQNISRIGSFPQVGMKIKNIWNHHVEIKSQKSYTRKFTSGGTKTRAKFHVATCLSLEKKPSEPCKKKKVTFHWILVVW